MFMNYERTVLVYMQFYILVTLFVFAYCCRYQRICLFLRLRLFQYPNRRLFVYV